MHICKQVRVIAWWISLQTHFNVAILARPAVQAPLSPLAFSDRKAASPWLACCSLGLQLGHGGGVMRPCALGLGPGCVQVARSQTAPQGGGRSWPCSPAGLMPWLSFVAVGSARGLC